jgi:endonuclease G|tara:strand:- start:87 stop:1286 length:1200 start_codon:yes stop_codon:yes gene_type:complete
MRRKKLIAVLFFGGVLSASLFYWNKTKSNDEILDNNDLEFYSSLIPESSSNAVYHESYYSYSYLKEHELSEWTIYLSTKSRLKNYETVKSKLLNSLSFSRPNFSNNPNISSSISTTDYRDAGFDRVHLVPLVDMSFNSTAIQESNYHTNTTPQRTSFNRGIWRELEQKVREWTIKYDSLIIITGCFFQDSLNYEETKIGKVSIPAFYYKIIIDMQRMSSIAFAIPNYDIGNDIDNELVSYVFPIKDLEEVISLDFFSGLPDSTEEIFEYTDQELAVRKERRKILKEEIEPYNKTIIKENEQSVANEADSAKCISGNCKNGIGTAIWYLDGKQQEYTGEWTNGYLHGKGVLINITGDITEGEFKNGLVDGLATRTYTDGRIISGEWKKGSLIKEVNQIID